MLTRKLIAGGIAFAVASACASLTTGAFATMPGNSTQTPIKHVVVIFQENVSFDHYFATYPHAQNPAGVPQFVASKGTPQVNGLDATELNDNLNAANPFRLTRAEALTCDENHDYTPEQLAFDGGLMDKFVQNTSVDTCSSPNFSTPNLVMGYYDGNTVTALWNYAQHFAMSDNSYDTNFGPSTPGALNLISGETYGGFSTPLNASNHAIADLNSDGVGTVMSDDDPTYDDCSNHSRVTMAMSDTNPNVGDMLSAKGITWGWFEGGFMPTSRTANGDAVCGAQHANIGGIMVNDYIPHHEPFQYYKSTSNPHHLPPTSVSMIGRQDQANHQYDIMDFWKAVDAGNMPAVSFLKAPGYQDGHAGYSDPLDEQTFIVNTINRLEKSPYWNSTAVIINYDDSDGWYDHVMSPIVKQSSDSMHDGLFDGTCGAVADGEHQDRCGYGPRLPLLVISPWAKQNYVQHSISDQSSILRFIEDNWNLGRLPDPNSFDKLAGSLDGMFNFKRHHADARLFLNPTSGEVASDDNMN